MAKVKPIKSAQSIDENLKHFVYESQSQFLDLSIGAVDEFLPYIKGKVVDLGCGDGAATNYLQKLGFKTVGVDINPDKLAKVKGKTVQSDMLSYLTSLPNNYIDTILCHHALEHAVDYKEILREIGRTLKGYCLIIVPELDGVHDTHHVEFESLRDIDVLKCTTILSEHRFRNQNELWYIGKKI